MPTGDTHKSTSHALLSYRNGPHQSNETFSLTTRPLPRCSRLLISLIVGYQRTGLGRLAGCRFEPSCSAYCIQAIYVHGAKRGTRMGLARIARCLPWTKRRYDPVPLGKFR